tara:strand:+ start:1490 stop:2452 length:963 start_codon:yes stop_codon:yes gene_type:complete
MAEKHSQVTIATQTWQYYLQQLWNFVQNTQSGIVQFVTEGGNVAIKSGGAFHAADTDLSSGFGSDGDYIVIEPVNAYPGGGKWQCKFVAVDVSDDETNECTVEVSWLGGYDTSADDFPAANQTSGALTYAVGYSKMASGDSWYFSCSNSDTYANNAGTQTYTYFRVLLFDSGASENTKFQGTYVGGYIPTEVNDDTKPVCLFTRIMTGTDNGTAWSDSDGTHCLAPGDYIHSINGGNISCTITQAGGETYSWFSLSRSGRWVNGPCAVLDHSNDTTLGVFGEYTLLKGTGNSYQRPDGGMDGTSKYKVAAELLFRWNTAA